MSAVIFDITNPLIGEVVVRLDHRFTLFNDLPFAGLGSESFGSMPRHCAGVTFFQLDANGEATDELWQQSAVREGENVAVEFRVGDLQVNGYLRHNSVEG